MRDKWRVPTLTLLDHRITCNNSSNFVVSQPRLSSHSCSPVLLPKIKLSLAYSLNPVFFFASSSLTPSPTILSFWNVRTAASCSIFSIQWMITVDSSLCFPPCLSSVCSTITKILGIFSCQEELSKTWKWAKRSTGPGRPLMTKALKGVENDIIRIWSVSHFWGKGLLLSSGKLHFSLEGLIIPVLPTSQGHYEAQRRFK